MAIRIRPALPVVRRPLAAAAVLGIAVTAVRGGGPAPAVAQAVPAGPVAEAAMATPPLDGLYAGTLTETWRHPEAHCPWASPSPVLRIAGGRAALRFHHDPPWEAIGPVAPDGRMRLEFGRGTEIDVEVAGAVEGTAFRGVLRTRYCAFAIELVRR